jgi:DNA-binding PadR family transcriptional regulator
VYAVGVGEPEACDDLPSTAWAVLGLLSFDEELTAYEVKQRADATLRYFYWSPAASAVYTELRRLESRGHVQSRVVPHAELSSKRLYRVTEAGARALAQWIRAGPFEPNQLKHYTALKALSGHLVEPSELAGLVRQHERWASGMLDELDQARSEARSPYAELVLEWSRDLYELEVAAARRMRERLEALGAQ